MKSKLLQWLVCPRCKTALECEVARRAGDEIEEGTLHCAACNGTHPIVRGIPRFVPPETYGASFGYQWNRFRLEQIDNDNATGLSAKRFADETGWTPESMTGQRILDAGCGAGRFLDVSSAANPAADVVGVDLSSAVEASMQNVGHRPNVHVVQASLYELPFRDGFFDSVYCIGVVQHTPDPKRTLEVLASMVRRGGRLAVTIYERRRFTLLAGKYLIRPLTRRMRHTHLLALIRVLMPVLFPLTEVLFRIPVLSRFFRWAIPVANYVEEPRLSMAQRYRWAILDTFDALSPRYDQPQRERDVVQVFRDAQLVDVQRGNAVGLNVRAVRR
jgi:SAM-dependent methyltransferase